MREKCGTECVQRVNVLRKEFSSLNLMTYKEKEIMEIKEKESLYPNRIVRGGGSDWRSFRSCVAEVQ